MEVYTLKNYSLKTSKFQSNYNVLIINNFFQEETSLSEPFDCPAIISI